MQVGHSSYLTKWKIECVCVISGAASLSHKYHCCPCSRCSHGLILSVSSSLLLLHFKFVLGGRENLGGHKSKKSAEKRARQFVADERVSYIRDLILQNVVSWWYDYISVFWTKWQCATAMWNGAVDEAVRKQTAKEREDSSKGARVELILIYTLGFPLFTFGKFLSIWFNFAWDLTWSLTPLALSCFC